MGFNNGLERVRLENQWKKLRVQYQAAGMSEEAIQAMYEFDIQVVNSEQTYYRHTVDLTGGNTKNADSNDTGRYEEAILTTDIYSETKTRFAWVGKIKDERLQTGLEKLSDDELQLITLYFHEGYSTVELSKVYGIAQQNISKRISKIANFLKKFDFQGVD